MLASGAVQECRLDRQRAVLSRVPGRWICPALQKSPNTGAEPRRSGSLSVASPASSSEPSPLLLDHCDSALKWWTSTVWWESGWCAGLSDPALREPFQLLAGGIGAKRDGRPPTALASDPRVSEVSGAGRPDDLCPCGQPSKVSESDAVP